MKTMNYNTIKNELIENKAYMTGRGIFTDTEIKNALSVFLAHYSSALNSKEVAELYAEIIEK